MASKCSKPQIRNPATVHDSEPVLSSYPHISVLSPWFLTAFKGISHRYGYFVSPLRGTCLIHRTETSLFSFLWGPNIFLSTLFSNTRHLRSSFKVIRHLTAKQIANTLPDWLMKEVIRCDLRFVLQPVDCDDGCLYLWHLTSKLRHEFTSGSYCSPMAVRALFFWRETSAAKSKITLPNSGIF